MTAPPDDLPENLALLRAYDWKAITLGKSQAAVWRLGVDGRRLFLKAAPRHPLSEFEAERARLEWLAGMGFSAPRLVDTGQSADRDWLLMTAVPGDDLTTLVHRPETLCRAMAQGLRRLHALDPSRCPFDHSLPGRVEDGAAHVAAGLVDETDFEPEHAGWRATEVLAWLRDNIPPQGTLVITHGDACVPNLVAQDGRFSGIVDCSRLGLADIWQDLALACRSIAHNCGREHVTPFLAAYGAAWDETRYRFYNALDELF